MLGFSKKVKIGLLSLLFVMASVFAFASFTKQSAAATSCDSVNIVKCGLSGTTVQDYINDIKTLNQTGTDGYGHTDMKFMLNWGGFSDQVIASMNTTNTKIGTLSRNGDITVDGKIVATETWITARFTSGTGFKQVTSGVWARLSSTSMMNATDQVLVTFDANGKAIAGTVIRCGNMLQFTPVIPAPVQVCNPATGNIESVPAGEASNYLPVDSDKCKVSVCDTSDHTIKLVPKAEENNYLPASSDTCQQIVVCNTQTNELNITIFKNQFDTSKYSTNPADCTPVTVCILNDKPNTTVIKKSQLDLTKYSLDIQNCTVSKPIPSTGPAEVASGLFGSSALGYGAYTYLASRRAIKHTLR